MGNLGPLAGQNHHFAHYAPEKIPYAIDRYVRETGRLYACSTGASPIARIIVDDYSIADILCYPWVLPERQVAGHRRVPAPQALEGRDPRASGGEARLRDREDDQCEAVVSDEEARRVLFGQSKDTVK